LAEGIRVDVEAHAEASSSDIELRGTEHVMRAHLARERVFAALILLYSLSEAYIYTPALQNMSHKALLYFV